MAGTLLPNKNEAGLWFGFSPAPKSQDIILLTEVGNWDKNTFVRCPPM